MSKYHVPKISNPRYEQGKKWGGGVAETRVKKKTSAITTKEEIEFCLNCKKPSCAYGYCNELKEFLGGKRIE